MAQTKVMMEQVGFTPSALIYLFKLDGTAIGLDTIFYFCDGTSTSFQPVVFNGITYTPIPIRVENMDYDGKGSQTRPKLTVSNINGFVSNLLLANTNLIGATVERTKVFARFLDAVNFPTPRPPWVTPDPTAAYAPEPFMVNRKVMENPQVVQFELGSPLETQGAMLPGRQIIANLCRWKYRDARTCGYSGPPVSDAQNRTFTGSFYNMTLVDKGAYSAVTTYARGDYVTTYSTLPQFSGVPFVWVCLANGTVGVNPSASTGAWQLDQCSKTVAGCKLRFTGQTPLRTSAFPGVSRANWIARA